MMELKILLQNEKGKSQILEDFIFLQKYAVQSLNGLEDFLYNEWFQKKWGYTTRFSCEKDLVQTALDSIPILKRLRQSGFQISNDVKAISISAIIKYVVYLQNDEVPLTINLSSSKYNLA